ncbi:MAG: hypothetical protein OEY49_12755 [Candidatus Heimdallarchaeota archaeon]|nr:hypothetical protein [Candidatus Heimdallarchaeota archaeon]
MSNLSSVSTKNSSNQEEITEEGGILASFKEIYRTLKQYHFEGKLFLYLFIITIIYNLVFFKIEAGYELYIYLPILMLILSYFTKYWENTNTIREKIGISLIVLAIMIDLILSISFIPTNNLRGYSIESIPTLIVDLGCMISFMHYFKYVRNNSMRSPVKK